MASILQQQADLAFVALMTWREARSETYLAKLAVAYTVVTRAKQPGWWGSSISTVLGRPFQYTSMTGPGDPNLILWPREADASWAECLMAANAALQGTEPDPAEGADSYFSLGIPTPMWATQDRFVVQIGRIRFYRVGLEGK